MTAVGFQASATGITMMFHGLPSNFPSNDERGAIQHAR